MPVLRSSLVDSGHEPGSDVHADAEGFIECHDGSITDHFHRAGVPYTAAIETTTETPAALADEINLIWMRGFIDLAAAAVTSDSRINPGLSGNMARACKPFSRSAWPSRRW